MSSIRKGPSFVLSLCDYDFSRRHIPTKGRIIMTEENTKQCICDDFPDEVRSFDGHVLQCSIIRNVTSPTSQDFKDSHKKATDFVERWMFGKDTSSSLH